MARGLILAGALAGLFVMHGLSDHGAAHPASGPVGAHARAALTDAATGPGGLDHTLTRAPGVTASHGTATAPSAASAAPAASDFGMMTLCFAVLASAFVAFARIRPSGEVLPWFEGAAVAGVALVDNGRERDPPSFVALSIRRC